MTLLNHHNQSGIKFQVFLDAEDVKDKAFILSYVSSEKTIDHGNALSLYPHLLYRLRALMLTNQNGMDLSSAEWI